MEPLLILGWSAEKEGFVEEVSFKLSLKGQIGPCQVVEKTEGQGILSRENSVRENRVLPGVWGQ